MQPTLEFQLGQQFFNQGQYQEAVECFTAAIKKQPANTELYKHRGDAYYHLGRYPESIADFTQAIAASRTQANRAANYHKLRGLAKAKLQQHQQAYEDFVMANRLAPQEPDYLIQAAKALVHLKQYQSAIDWVNAALKLNNHYAPAYECLALMKSEQGLYQEALDSAYQAHRLEPNTLSYFTLMANNFISVGRVEEAIKWASTVVQKDSKNADAYQALGAANAKLKRYQQAFDNYVKAHRLEPANANHCSQAAYALLGMNNYTEALTWAEAALQKDAQCSEAYRHLGNAHRNLSQYQAAIVAYDKAITLGDHDAIVYNSRGLAKSSLGQRQDAFADFERASQLDTQNAVYPANAAEELNRLGKYEEVITWANTAIERNKQYAWAYELMGDAYRCLGQYQKAIDAYTQALDYNPNLNASRATSIHHRGLCYSELVFYDKALADYEEAIKINLQLTNRNKDLAANYQCMGHIYLWRYEYTIAETLYEKAIVLNPECALAKVSLAHCLQKGLQFGKALKLCEAASKLAPAYDRAYLRKGLICIDVQEFYQAYLSLDKGASLSLNDSTLQAYLGFSRLLCKERDMAAMLFNKLLHANTQKVMDVPEYYLDNALANKRFNKENSSSITGWGEELCQFGLQCIAFLDGKTDSIVSQKRIANPGAIFAILLMGFIQAYSKELQTNYPARFKKLCQEGQLAIEQLAKQDKSALVANYAERLANLIAYTNKLLANANSTQLDTLTATDAANKAKQLNELGRYEEAIIQGKRALQLDAQHADAYRYLGNAYHRLNRPQEAIEAYNKAIALSPNEAKYYCERGLAKSSLNLLQQAVEDYAKASQLDSQNAEYAALAASTLSLLGKHEEIITWVTTRIQRNDKDPFSYGFLGGAYKNLGRYQEAIEAYNKAITLKPDNATFYGALGTVKSKSGHYQEAVEAYNKAIALRPNHADYYSDRGSAYSKSGQYQQASADFEKASELDPQKVSYPADAAAALIQLGNYEKAIIWANTAIQRGGQYAVEALNEMGKPKEAINWSITALQRCAQAVVLAYIYLGDAYGRLNRYQEAVEAYSKLIDLSPSANFYNKRGVAYSNLDYHEKALLDFKQASQLNNHVASFPTNAADSLNQLGRYAEAITWANTALGRDRQYALAHHYLGDAYRHLGQYQKAIEAYNLALEHNPNSNANRANSIHSRGLCHHEMGFHVKALADYEEAIKLNLQLPNRKDALSISYYCKGFIHLDTQEFHQAYLSFDKGASLASTDSDLQVCLGFSHLLCKKQDIAFSLFDQLLSAKPTKEVEELCLFGLQCIAFLRGETTAIAAVKQMTNVTSNFCTLLVGFIQAYSGDFQASCPAKFKALCEEAKQVIEQRVKRNKSARANNCLERILQLEAHTAKLLEKATSSPVSPEATENPGKPIGKNIAQLMRSLSIHEPPSPVAASDKHVTSDSRTRSGTLPIKSQVASASQLMANVGAFKPNNPSATSAIEQAYRAFLAAHTTDDPLIDALTEAYQADALTEKVKASLKDMGKYAAKQLKNPALDEAEQAKFASEVELCKLLYHKPAKAPSPCL